MNERITAFVSRFRLTGRQWLVAGAAGCMAIAVFWMFWGNFDIQFGRFFAFDPGERECARAGNMFCRGNEVWMWDTDVGGGYVNGLVETCAAPKTCVQSGTTASCQGGTPPTATPDPGGGGGGGEVPTDPSGDCEFRSQFNAPGGAWFCPGLQCALAGNPPFEPNSARKPPEGPASHINIHVMGANPQPVDPALGPVFIRYKLDSTPKCGNGKECYPPKDPLWSCTRADGKEVDLGRNGHDFYDCYNPIIRLYDYVPVTCCANTGLSGDCFTWSAGDAGPSGPSEPPEPTPTPEPLFCDPSTQTIAEGGIARATARGGDKRYTWEITGGGQLVEGGMETISVKYPVYGTKGLSVRSAGLEAVCTVVVTGGPTATPVPGDGDLSVTKTGFISGTGTGGTSFIEVSDGQTAEFIVRIENNGENEITGIVLTDEVPEGMSYEEGSTKVEGLTISNDSIVDTGLVLGRLDADDSVIIRWRATANRVGELPPGPALQHPTAVVEFDDGDDIEADMDVNVYGTGENLGGTGTGGTGGAAAVGTGPGGATLMAMLAAAAAALLYAGYTRSDAYHRREVERMTRERDPLDFRS